MCVSAQVSFGLAAILVPAGVYCSRAALARNPGWLALSAIPTLFGIQQIAEGFVWIGLGTGSSEAVRRASQVFLFFALALWPFWIPFCAFVSQRSGRGRIGYGFVMSLALLLGLVAFVPIVRDPEFPLADVADHSLRYHVARSPVFAHVPMSLWIMLYAVVVTSPMITSPDARHLYAGVALVLSAALTYILFRQAFASVWCFLAAILSLYLCLVFRNLPPAKLDAGKNGS